MPDGDVWVGTFHSLCVRLLRIYAPLVGIDNRFTIYDQSDRLDVVKQVIEARQIDCQGVAPERIESVISRAKNSMTTPAALNRGRLDVDCEIAEIVYPLYQDRLRELSAVDFDDLLIHVVTILKNNPKVRAELDRKFAYIMVDEYQDTNLAQYSIVRGLSIHQPNLCVTGDPDQSIYAWRGADLNNILEFERDFPGCKVVKLERNYRSTRNILKAANALIKNNIKRKPKDLLTENETGEAVELTVYEDERAEAAGVAGLIRGLIDSEGVSAGDCAVFFRVTALSRNLEMALNAAGLPHQIIGTVAFYERQEIKDLVAYLQLASNPRDDVAFDRVSNTPPRGFGKMSHDALSEFARKQGVPRLAAAALADQIQTLKAKPAAEMLAFAKLIERLAQLRDHSAETVVKELLTLTRYEDYVRQSDKVRANDRLANIGELVTAAEQYDQDHPSGGIAGFLEQTALSSAIDRWKDDQGAVSLMTLHAAKGLEFDVVFIIGVEQGLLPHGRASQSADQNEEERRLFFVGMTRARKRLFISYCASESSAARPPSPNPPSSSTNSRSRR